VGPEFTSKVRHIDAPLHLVAKMSHRHKIWVCVFGV